MCVPSHNLSVVFALGSSFGSTAPVCLSARFTSSCFLTCSTSVRSSFAILTESSRQSGFVVWKIGSLITIGYRHSACHTLLRNMPKPMKDKFAIAAALQEIGTRLELKGGQYFKARAYKLGARSLAEVTEDLGKLIKENRLTFVKGIGYALARQIEELYTTGQSSLLNQLRAEMPPGIVELSNVRGLTVKKVEQLHEALGVSTVDELKAAAETGKLRELKGFTAKTEARIL